MKSAKLLMAACASLIALLATSDPAQAHGRWRGGVVLHFGFPGPYYWGPRYYYPPPPPVYYYPAPPLIAAPAAPPTYIERDDDEAPPPSPSQWWYWCPSAKGYYPYVKDCPGGWQRVPPQPMN
jgi:hypothetical protein